ncbi:MAG: hypothetical protein R3276_10560 [Marinobacter sp.]|nr:hypothetical protein [Marinobacter sp.]
MTAINSVGRGLMLAGAVLLAGQVVAAPGGKNSEDHPGQGNREAAGQQRYQMEEHAEQQRQRMTDEAEDMRDRAEDEAERRREEAEDMRERAEEDAERRRERAEKEGERRREEAEGMRERAENEAERGGRPEQAGGPEVNPGERGSEQGQTAKRENAKAWWNFWGD